MLPPCLSHSCCWLSRCPWCPWELLVCSPSPVVCRRQLMLFPRGNFCLQGQFWCHWSPGEKGGLAVTGLGCSSWGTYVPPSQAGSGLGFFGWHLPSTGRALAVQGTEHLRGKQSWGCSVFRERLQKDPFGRDSELFQLCQNKPVGCEGVGQSGRFLVPKGSW